MPVEFTCVYSTPNRAKNFKRKAFEFAFLRPQNFSFTSYTQKKNGVCVYTSQRSVPFRKRGRVATDVFAPTRSTCSVANV